MYSNSRSLLVNDVMSFPVITGKEKDSIKSIAEKMYRHRIGAVVITNKLNEPIGIVTQGDIVRRLMTKKRRMLFFSRASHVMSRHVITINKEMKIEDAARFMVKSRVKRLCVVDEANKVIGMITDNDIMKNSSYLIEVLNEIIDTGYVREEEIGIKS